ncbi:hypothetical protein BMS3Abin07_00829 [bacterium BMS3Abin07]|nr:hypothetical protein BMS3Abin07_00829 [bacterium BMS3Abin07]GBE33020.1 hypothetical protein BMS3Bbin05_01952 [bacterium BMS3Bbin05]
MSSWMWREGVYGFGRGWSGPFLTTAFRMLVIAGIVFLKRISHLTLQITETKLPMGRRL